MKSKIIFFLGVLAVFGASFSYGEDIKLDALLFRMDEADKKAHAVRFEFSQEIVYTLTGEKQSNFGETIFQKPNSLYLKQNKPIEQLIISNGKKVWVYTPSYGQVLVDNWKRWTNNSLVPASMTNFGQNLEDLKKKYSFSYMGIDDGKYLLSLIPIKKEMWQLKLWIDKQTFIPVRARLTGENITINTEAKNYEINPEIDKNIFTYQPKSGVEVLNVP